MSVAHHGLIRPPDPVALPLLPRPQPQNHKTEPRQSLPLPSPPQDRAGALLPQLGFVASAHARQPQAAPRNTHFTGSAQELTKSGSAHIAQWKEGTWSSPSHFISASYSLPYVLFETQRRGAPPAAHWYRGTEMQVSVIDALALPGDVYLGTELVGAYYHDAAFFSRWSQEVLVYGWIPAAAVVATMSVDEFYSCLPKWCGGVRALISPRGHWSTQEVAGFLKILAECNNTPAKEEALVVQSIERSIALLRNAQPRASVHERVDKITRLAAMFCWWPKWIKGTAGTDPAAYTALLRRVEERVRERLQLQLTPSRSPVEVERRASGVVRTPTVSPRKAPYAGRPKV